MSSNVFRRNDTVDAEVLVDTPRLLPYVFHGVDTRDDTFCTEFLGKDACQQVDMLVMKHRNHHVGLLDIGFLQSFYRGRVACYCHEVGVRLHHLKQFLVWVHDGDVMVAVLQSFRQVQAYFTVSSNNDIHSLLS